METGSNNIHEESQYDYTEENSKEAQEKLCEVPEMFIPKETKLKETQTEPVEIKIKNQDEIYPCILKLKETEVIPDVIDAYPEEMLVVKYGSIMCNPGDTMKPIWVSKPPDLDWNADNNAFYTVCMTDPDAPNRRDPRSREWHHWLVVNIPGKKIENGETLSEYIGAGPPKGTGLHRYVLLVYKQDGRIEFDEKRLKRNSGIGRGKFSTKNFARKYGLGAPVAANVFMAEWDDYVPKLQRQLAG